MAARVRPRWFFNWAGRTLHVKDRAIDLTEQVSEKNVDLWANCMVLVEGYIRETGDHVMLRIRYEYVLSFSICPIGGKIS